MAWRAWGTHRHSNLATAAPRAPRRRLLPTVGSRAPRWLLAYQPPWACAPEVAARGARSTGLELAEVGSLRAGALIAFGAMTAIALIALGGVSGLVAAVCVGAFGAAYPDLWLRSAARRRTDAVERSAPLVLELIAVTVTAGVDLDVALRGAATAAAGPLRDELELSLRRVELGAPRREELRDLADRTGSPSMAGLALAVGLADRLGVPLAASLDAQARRARRERARTVEEQAAKASPKVLVVVVFVLVPAALLPILAAVALSVAGALGGSGL